MYISPVLLEAAAVFSAALILIAALAWNNVAQSWFDFYNPFEDELTSQLAYAIIVTIVAIFLLVVLRPYRRISGGEFWVVE